MTSKTEKKTTAIHVLPNISISKDDQTMTSGQLIQYSIRNIFLEAGRPVPRTLFAF